MKTASPVVIITGAGSGLGEWLGRKLLGQGCRVFGHYHRHAPDYLETAHTFQADLSDQTEAAATVANCVDQWGRVDALINNAGVYHEKDLFSLTGQEWFEGLNTTATACFFMTRAALPHLRRSNLRRVINIGDSSAERLSKRNLAVSYHIGKTGVLLLTKSFAAAEVAHGVTVNMVSPGMLENSVGKPDVGEMPSGRFGRFDDIGNAVDFLLSSQSDHVTGTNLIVGGGWNL
ncbi:SDR family oxidoreductase [Kamptonema cortianum]|nr:SDR family oxidoreductase [Kamptonema cortianum]MDL5046168.1 SDR family oxidoreductase [Oscillatoria amoena NRMC-F 0135]